MNSELYEHFRSSVRILAADGGAAERRILFHVLRANFPNVFFVIRDVAHAVRIASMQPLHYDVLFGKFWNELFNYRHALVPDIQNSEKWKQILEAIQVECLRIPDRASPLKSVLKHLSFAEHRFESYVDPLANLYYCYFQLQRCSLTKPVIFGITQRSVSVPLTH